MYNVHLEVVKFKGGIMSRMNMDDFDQWLKDLVYPSDVEDLIEVIYDGGQGDPDTGYEIKKKVAFYTDEHKYFIVAIEEENGDGYLGCQVSARKPRAGETWTRGNDLPDGKFTTQTLEQIKNKIIAYELQQLSVKAPIQEIPEE
jgi:hypothetical protein